MMRIDDGRHVVQTSTNLYDLILSEPSNPWLAGVSNLFTQEFYVAARKRLTRHGMLAQWIQSYSLTRHEYALVVRTIRSVFPHCGLIRVNDGDTLLIASQTPLIIDREKLQHVQALFDSVPEARADLLKYYETADIRSLLLQHFVLDDVGLEALAGRPDEGPINTDVNLRLEFDSPRHLFRRNIRPDENANLAILARFNEARFRRVFREWGCSAEHLAVVERLVRLFSKHGQDKLVDDLLDFALEVQPDHPFFLAAKQSLAKLRASAQ
jgi:hypothetical protein